jgi:predicted adenylyl cyclase CyaB
MMLEIEAKLRLDNLDDLRDRLVTLGANHRSTVLETNIILDHEKLMLRNQACGLRIRGAAPIDGGNSKVTVTYKGPPIPGRYKSREEIEFITDDWEQTVKLYARLGFVTMLHYQKHRESWQLGNCLVEMDQLPEIGLFAEIEGPDEDSIHRVQEQLGLEGITHVESSYVQMLLTYCMEHDINPPVLLLP